MPRYRYSGTSLPVQYVDGHTKSVRKGAFNWCKSIYVDSVMNASDGWVFGAGQPCSGQPQT